MALDRRLMTKHANGREVSTYDLFLSSGGDSQEMRDFRMCADIVWWIILQLKADRIWMP